ncbi:hypothetical protein ABDK56_06340 [Sphingomonas sp. ASV193]|uniref:hypothetical protein n=1 Tax=Sphingomonas sp. ASV193 TaxID=3144405 RepID=UPI0032E8E8C2
MRNGWIVGAALALTGCIDEPPAPPPPPQVAAGTADASLAAAATPATLARWQGSFRSNGETLTIAGTRTAMTVSRGGRTQPLAFVGYGTFSDPAGIAYLFMPADGSGQLVTIAPGGARRTWVR